MVELISASTIIGSESTSQTSLLPSQEKTFFKIPDSQLESVKSKYPEFSRSLPRDGYIGLWCIERLKAETKQELGGDRVGMYTAFQNGPNLYPLLEKIKSMNLFDAIVYFKKWWPPKQHFRQNAPIRANHFSIANGLHGPQMCFVDPRTGLVDAINAAEIDLQLGIVDMAVVVTAFSFEDLQTTSYYAMECSNLYESGVALLLKNRPNSEIKITPKPDTPKLDKGVCTPYLNKQITF